MGNLAAGYRLTQGSSLDHAALVQFMERTYRELYPDQPRHHLKQTVESHLGAETPLWWIEALSEADGFHNGEFQKVGCLWLGNAIDQPSGSRLAYVLMLYVDPSHRRQGLATVLLETAQTWARVRGDRQISLQVFCHNQPALKLYEKLGYSPHAITLIKPLSP